MGEPKYVQIPVNIRVPEHIFDAMFIQPPLEIIQLVQLHSPDSHVFFYEHKSVQQSYHYFANIFVNARLTFWKNYNVFPLSANSLGEVIALRVLHELGHILSMHRGSIVIEDGKVMQIVPDIVLQQCESEAWQWALNYRMLNADPYRIIVEKCQIFIDNHQYIDKKDW